MNAPVGLLYRDPDLESSASITSLFTSNRKTMSERPLKMFFTRSQLAQMPFSSCSLFYQLRRSEIGFGNSLIFFKDQAILTKAKFGSLKYLIRLLCIPQL
jgi:hypothetical protein